MNAFLLMLTLLSIPWEVTALSADGLALLALKSAVSGDPLASWSESDADPCRWPGVFCANISGAARVVGIAVSGKSLTGYIPSELGSLVFLRRLNLHGNRLSGSIPAQLFAAASLHSLYLYGNNLTGPIPASLCDIPRLQNLDLSRNSLSGELPAGFRNCRQLQRLILAENQLSGRIPAGIWPEMDALVELDLSSNHLSGFISPDIGELRSLSGTLNLSHNRFSGRIPDELGRLPTAVSLDLRYNNLSGEIPQAGLLGSQGPTAFLNNPGLCGFPLQIPCPDFGTAFSARGHRTPEAEAATKRNNLRPGLIVLIAAADAAAVALIGLAVVYFYWWRMEVHHRRKSEKLKDHHHHERCSWWWRKDEEDDDGDREEEAREGELVVVDKGPRLELEELLRASAYVLGKGGMGIVYKVVVGSGAAVAVRRLGEGGGGEGQRHRDFASEAESIGRLQHPNVVRLRAYYWAPDEKLLITDFIANGNLAAALRGRSGQPILSWSIRLRIVKGAARGLAYLHDCSPRKLVHGAVKPSNILLDIDYNPFISDFGLTRLINIAGISDTSSSSLGFIGAALPVSKHPPIERPNNYRAPEARLPGARPAQKWDVYSLGVVMLELLTGKPPELSSPSSSSPVSVEPELVRWVRKGFDDANPLSEMVDPALLREVYAKKEVLSVFHVALACTELDPESRPRMKVVFENLDGIGR